MGRPKKSAKPQHVEPEDESQEPPEQAELGSTPPEPAARKGITKSEAVRRALAAGYEGPQEGTAYILKEFGIEVAPQHFSSTKSQLKSKEGGATTKAKPGRKPKPAVEGDLAPPPKIEATGEGDLIDVLEKMKPLIAQYGADKVKRLVDLLG